MSTLDSQTVAYLITILIQCGLFLWAYSKQTATIDKEREQWQKERKDLLDRIQAPNFAEYTNKVVREKKAEQPEEKIEPVEFVS